MRLPRWLKPDLDKRPSEPTPRPVLYDWQQDEAVITDLKLWNVFTVVIDPGVTQACFISEHATKPQVPKRIVPRNPEDWESERLRAGGSQPLVTFPDPGVRDLPRPTDYGDAVKPWGPGAHITGLRPGMGPGVRSREGSE